MTQVVTQLIVDASGAKQGVAEFEAAMKRAKDAAVAGGDRASSFEQAQRKWTASLASTDPVIKQQIAMERDLYRQRQVNTEAVRLGIATQVAADAQLERVRQRHVALIRDIRGHSQAAEALRGQTVALAGSMGPLGSLLTALGPAGIALGAAMAVATLGVAGLVKSVNDLAREAGKMTDFADTTGLTTSQLQALNKSAANVGIDSEKLGTSFEKFSVQLDDVRRGSGGLFEALNRLDPALTRQLQLTRSAGEAWDVMARAMAAATTQEQRNAIARAAFGRQGVPLTRLATESSGAGGLAALEAANALDAMTKAQLVRWDEIIDRIAITTAAAKRNFASIFADDVLAAQDQSAQKFLELSRIAKNFTISDDLRTLILGPGGGASQLPGAFEPFGWLKILVEYLPLLRQIQTGGVGALPAPLSAPGRSWRAAPADQALRDQLAPGDPVRETDASRVARMQREIALLGEAATAEEKRAATIAKMRLEAKEAGIADGLLARAIAQVNQAYSDRALSLRINMLGDMATAAEVVAQKQSQLNDAVRAGAKFTEAETAAILARTRAMYEARQLPNQLQFERNQLNRDPIEAEVAARLRAEYGADYEKHMLGAEAAMIRGNAELRETKQLIDQIGSAFVSALVSGDGFAQSMASSFSRIGQQMATGNLNRFLNGGSLFGSGNLMSAQGAAGVLGAGMMGYQSGSPLMGALGGALAGASFGPAGMAVGAIAGGLGGLLGGNAQKEQAKQQQYQENINMVLQVRQRIADAQADTSTRAGQMAQLEAKFAEERRQAAAKGAGWVVQIERAHAAERAAIARDYAEQDLARQQAFQDRAFLAANDNSTLQGALLAFDRAAIREREAELREGGAAIADLEAALAAERLNIIERFNDQAIAEQERLAAAQLQATLGVAEYLAQLRAGPDSPLSPGARLTAARDIYTATLALAQGGNVDALSRIPQEAETYRQAGLAMYGSAAGYQSIYSQIQTQLGNLPQLVAATDPIVLALRDVVSAVGGTTSAVNAVNSTTAGVTGAVNAVNSTTAGVTGAVNSVNTAIDGDGGTNDILAELRNLNTTLTRQFAGQQIGISSSGFTTTQFVDGGQGEWYPVTTSVTGGVLSDAAQFTRSEPAQQVQGNVRVPSSVDNTMLTALNKIVFNTWAIAFNTAQLRAPAPHIYGIYESGGWVGGDRHINGGTMISAERDEFVLRRGVALQNQGWLPEFNRTGRLPSFAASNDNVVGAIDAMHRTMAAMLARLAALEEHGNEKLDRLHKQNSEWQTSDQRAQRSLAGRAGRAA